MSRNVSALDQEQAVAAHSMPVFGSPPRCPPIPHFTNLAYLMQLPDPPPLPQLAASLKPKKARQQLTAIHAKYGFVAAASVAAQYHNAGNPGIAEPYTTEELIVRDLYARQHLGGVFSTYHQDAENAVVLRLLIPRAGQKLPFELDATWGRNSKGKPVYGRQCGYDDCEFRGQDRTRHMDGVHVKNPLLALCCHHNDCGTVTFCGRDSEMDLHLAEKHKK